MKAILSRYVLSFIVAVALTLLLFVFVSHSAYAFALGLTVATFLARLTSFKGGVILGLITALPLSLYLVLSGFMPGADRYSLYSVLLNILILTIIGGLYSGVVVWLINRLKAGKIFFS